MILTETLEIMRPEWPSNSSNRRTFFIQVTWESYRLFPPNRPVQLKSSHLEIRHQVVKLGPQRQMDGYQDVDVYNNIYRFLVVGIQDGSQVYKMILAFFAWGAFLLFWVCSYSTASVLHPSLEGNGVESWDVVRNGPRHKIGNVLHQLVFRHLFFWATVHSLCRNQFRTILKYFKRSCILSIFQNTCWFKMIQANCTSELIPHFFRSAS